MNESTTFERVRKVVVDQLGVKESEVVTEAWLGQDLGADSLDVVEVVMGLEDEFGIDIPDDEIRTDMKVEEVVKLIEGKIQ